jgi:7-carboxy-7-deazaguanine synthase
MEISGIRSIVKAIGCKLVEVTGGEPLVQPETKDLMLELWSDGYTLLLETNGSLSVAGILPYVHIIMDIKTPSSREESQVLWNNLDCLTEKDEIKLVISDRIDYEWARNVIQTRLQSGPNAPGILLSPAYSTMQPDELAKWILDDGLNVRFQLQMHKYIWPADKKGV